MLEVLPLDRKRLGFQSFAGIILAGERSRKGVDELGHPCVEWANVGFFESGGAARHHLSQVRHERNGTLARTGCHDMTRKLNDRNARRTTFFFSLGLLRGHTTGDALLPTAQPNCGS
jgi:hypothetical protein